MSNAILHIEPGGPRTTLPTWKASKKCRDVIMSAHIHRKRRTTTTTRRTSSTRRKTMTRRTTPTPTPTPTPSKKSPATAGEQAASRQCRGVAVSCVVSWFVVSPCRCVQQRRRYAATHELTALLPAQSNDTVLPVFLMVCVRNSTHFQHKTSEFEGISL